MDLHSQLERVLLADPDSLAKAEALPDEPPEPAHAPRKTEPEPQPAAVEDEGPALLRDGENFFKRFVILPGGVPLALSAWTIATHIYDAFDCFPYLAFSSPAKRCGKTRATEVLELIAASARRAVNLSEAALFRLIESQCPTLILDEAESLSGRTDRAEALRSLLNAGNRKGTKVYRCDGNTHALKDFEVYCPKVFCCIGGLPDTIADRSIVVSMQRKKPGEDVERFTFREVGPEGEALRRRVETFAETSRPAIESAYQTLRLPFLSDRDEENWLPLFAVLAVAHPSRTDELRRCAERLTQQKAANDEDETLALRLLGDLRDVWPEGEAASFTTHLLESLKGIGDAPWAGDVELTARKMARFLRPFGVQPRQVRVGPETAKGYAFDELEAAFVRYLAPEGKHGKQPA